MQYSVASIVSGDSTSAAVVLAAVVAVFGLGGTGMLAYQARRLLKAGHTVEVRRRLG